MPVIWKGFIGFMVCAHLVWWMIPVGDRTGQFPADPGPLRTPLRFVPASDSSLNIRSLWSPTLYAIPGGAGELAGRDVFSINSESTLLQPPVPAGVLAPPAQDSRASWKPDPLSVISTSAAKFLKEDRLPLRAHEPVVSTPVSLQVLVDPPLWQFDQEQIRTLIRSHKMLPNHGQAEVYVGVDAEGLVEELVLSKGTDVFAFNRSLLAQLRKRLEASTAAGQGVVRIEWAFLHAPGQSAEGEGP